jgi:uncharacterized protein
MNTTTAGISAKPLDGRPFDMRKVHYSPRWLSAGALLASLLLTGAQQYRGRSRATWMAAVGMVGLAGLAYSTMVEPAHPRLERLTLKLPQLPVELAGLRIGQLSDLHLGHAHTARNARWAVAELLRERPELIVITGDLVSSADAIADLPDVLRPLQAPLGIFAVPGNHDHWEGLPAIEQLLQPLGIEFLVNKQRLLEWRGSHFCLAGLDDLWNGSPDYTAALAEVADIFTILLSHAPDSAAEAAHYGVDVQLSGHTHGGHICLPLLGPFSLPKYGIKHAAGHEYVDAMQLYVSRGLGGMPLRFGCPPELTILTLAH